MNLKALIAADPQMKEFSPSGAHETQLKEGSKKNGGNEPIGYHTPLNTQDMRPWTGYDL